MDSCLVLNRVIQDTRASTVKLRSLLLELRSEHVTPHELTLIHLLKVSHFVRTHQQSMFDFFEMTPDNPEKQLLLELDLAYRDQLKVLDALLILPRQ